MNSSVSIVYIMKQKFNAECDTFHEFFRQIGVRKYKNFNAFILIVGEKVEGEVQ